MEVGIRIERGSLSCDPWVVRHRETWAVRLWSRGFLA